MKKPLNYPQLILLSRNGSNPLLETYFTYEELTDRFFLHLQAYSSFFAVSLALAEPFLSADFEEPVQSSLLLADGIPLGEFFLFHHSVSAFGSLVYSSSHTDSETVLLHASRFQTYTVHQYLTLLETLVSSLLIEKKVQISTRS